MKKCGQCKIEKDNNQFSPSQLKKSGGECRSCNTKNAQKYREDNSEKIKTDRQEYDAKYYQKNKKGILKNKKGYYQENREEILQELKIERVQNKGSKRKYNKFQYQNNETLTKDDANYELKKKNKQREYRNAYYKEKRKNDLNFRIKTNISANISFYLKSNGASKNGKSTIKYLPYSIDQLKNHLQTQFEPWMTWENYGRNDVKNWNDGDPTTWTWQIDHIIPHLTFNYTSIQDGEFKKAWALTNLRPYSAKQNWLDGIYRTRH